MAAKPRVTVRLAPATLHQLAYIAARDKLPPAECARMMVTSICQTKIRTYGWMDDWQETYKAWQAEQAAAGERAEVPDQADYDRLADGPPMQPELPGTSRPHTPLSETIAQSDAFIKRTAARLAGANRRV